MDYDKIREMRYRLRRASSAPPNSKQALKEVIDVVDEILLELVAPQHTHPAYDVSTPKEDGS